MEVEAGRNGPSGMKPVTASQDMLYDFILNYALDGCKLPFGAGRDRPSGVKPVTASQDMLYDFILIFISDACNRWSA